MTNPTTNLHRKRSHSSTSSFNLSLPYDTKRARIGIQELTTNQFPRPPTPHSNSLLNSSKGSKRTENHSSEKKYTSSGPDSGRETNSSQETSSSEETSSSSSDDDGESLIEREIDEGYDSDSESGSTTTTSSSSSSGEEEKDGDSDDNDKENRSSRSLLKSFAGQSRDRLWGPSSTSLAAKLDAFLPKMAAANAELDGVRLRDRNIEEVDDEGRYIEMDLGLGVLEEKRDVDLSGSDNDGDESSAGSIRSKSSIKSRHNDTMGVLMGRKRARKPNIQVVEV